MITATDLSKYYGETRALDRVSFEVADGECVGFVGRNGAGKTTVLKILATALLPSSGTVTVDGHDVVEEPDAVRRVIGFLPEEPPLYREMTPRTYLRYLGRLRGVSAEAVEGRIEHVARQTDISDMLDDPIDTLSLGYRKRVGIAQAIVHDPKLVIVDEPISGLDPLQIVEIRELLRGLRGQHTVLLSSHILTELAQTADRFLVIDRGRIVVSGTEDELISASADARIYVVNVEARGTRSEFETALDGLTQLESSDIKEADGMVYASLRLKEDAPDLVAERLVKAGLRLRSLSAQASNLESIFVELTGKEAA